METHEFATWVRAVALQSLWSVIIAGFAVSVLATIYASAESAFARKDVRTSYEGPLAATGLSIIALGIIAFVAMAAGASFMVKGKDLYLKLAAVWNAESGTPLFLLYLGAAAAICCTAGAVLRLGGETRRRAI